jgi:hypothetical protein
MCASLFSGCAGRRPPLARRGAQRFQNELHQPRRDAPSCSTAERARDCSRYHPTDHRRVGCRRIRAKARWTFEGGQPLPHIRHAARWVNHTRAHSTAFHDTIFLTSPSTFRVARDVVIRRVPTCLRMNRLAARLGVWLDGARQRYGISVQSPARAAAADCCRWCAGRPIGGRAPHAQHGELRATRAHLRSEAFTVVGGVSATAPPHGRRALLPFGPRLKVAPPTLALQRTWRRAIDQTSVRAVGVLTLPSCRLRALYLLSGICAFRQEAHRTTRRRCIQ